MDRGMLHRRLSLLAVLLATSLACTGVINKYNALPLAPYVDGLNQVAGTSMEVLECQMSPNSRLGWCLLMGGEPEAKEFSRTFSQGERLMEGTLHRPCLEELRFGERRSGTWRPRDGVFGWNFKRALAPPSEENIQLDRIWVDGPRVCIELQFLTG